MNRIELYIDGVRVELFKDETITLTQSIKKLQNIDTIFSDYTQNFTVPASKSNQRIFKRLESGSVANGYNFSNRASAEIKMNGMAFKKGYINIEKANIVEGVTESYTLFFVGGLANLKGKLKDTEIRDLSGLAAYLFNEGSAIEAELKSPVDDLFRYSLVTNERVFYDSSSIVSDTNNLAYTPLNDNGVPASSIRPSLRVKEIITGIERSFDIEFSDDFFKNESVREFNELYMLLNSFTNEYGMPEGIADLTVTTNNGVGNYEHFTGAGHSGDDSYSQINGLGLEDGVQSIQYDQTLSFDKEDSDGNQLVSITYKFTPSNDDEEFVMYSPYSREPDPYMNTPSTGVTEHFVDVRNGKEWEFKGFGLQIPEGMTVYIEVIANYRGLGGDNDVGYRGSVVGEYGAGSELRAMLPKIKVIDILKGLFTMFNLVAYEDDNGVIVVQTYDDFQSGGVDIDITRYVDSSKEEIKLPYQYSGIDYRYDKLNTIRNRDTSINTWGSYVLDEGEVNSGGSPYKLKLPFSLMKYTRMIDRSDDSGTTIQVGEVVNAETLEPMETKAVLHYINQVTWNDGIALKTADDSNVKLTTFNVPSNTVDLENDFNDSALWFGNELSEYTGRPEFKGLYEKYHSGFASPLFVERNRIINVTAYIPSHIISTIKLKDIFVYKSTRYRINSLVQNLQSGDAKIEMIGISELGADISSEIITGNAPVITVVGSSEIDVSINSIFVDTNGATASDVEDGNITADIEVISQDIDTSTISTQFIRYYVEDSDGNSDTAVRVVNIVDNTPPTITVTLNSVASSSILLDYSAFDSGVVNSILFLLSPSGEDMFVEQGKVLPFNTSATGTFTYPSVQSGDYDVKAIARDAAGNETESSIVTVTV